VLVSWLEHDSSPVAVVGGRRIAPDGSLGPIARGPRVAQHGSDVVTVALAADALGGGLLGVRTTGGAGPFWQGSFSFDAAPPALDASVPTSAVVGDDVPFTGEASDRSGVSVWWDFGDGSGAPSATAHHAYAKPGSYVVTLTATDGAGNQSARSHLLVVLAAPAPQQRQAPLAAHLTPPRRTSAKLRLRVARRRGAHVAVRGTIAASAGGAVRIVYAQKAGRRTVRKRATAKIAHGRWGATLTLTGALRRAAGHAKATVTVAYAGNATTKAASARRAVVAARRGLTGSAARGRGRSGAPRAPRRRS
jgi:hypothetical protein